MLAFAFRRLLVLLLVTTVALSQVRPIRAWNRAGHMVTGAVAYQSLKQSNPETLTKVLAILKSHPDYRSRWAEWTEKVAPGDRDLVIVMLAARWPDDIRETDLDRPTHHYISRPFKPDGVPDSIRPFPPADENITFAFRQNLEVLRSDKPDVEKAVALCWLFHLVGDVHQPLHTCTLYSERFPKSDRGGTIFFIKADPNGETISLHQLWDGLVIGSERVQETKNQATALRATFPKATLDEIAEEFTATDFQKWIDDEGFPIAVKESYLDGKLDGGITKESAVALPEGYIKAGKAIAERRMALAGFRLAEVLKAAMH
jgi:hypothetical protein